MGAIKLSRNAEPLKTPEGDWTGVRFSEEKPRKPLKPLGSRTLDIEVKRSRSLGDFLVQGFRGFRGFSAYFWWKSSLFAVKGAGNHRNRG